MDVYESPLSYADILKSQSKTQVKDVEDGHNTFLLWDYVSDDVKEMLPAQKNVYLYPKNVNNDLGLYEKDFPPINLNKKKEKKNDENVIDQALEMLEDEKDKVFHSDEGQGSEKDIIERRCKVCLWTLCKCN